MRWLFGLTCAAFLVAFIVSRRRMLSVPYLSLLAYFVFGVPGSFVALSGRDWWVRDVSQRSLEVGFVAYSLVGLALAVAVTLWAQVARGVPSLKHGRDDILEAAAIASAAFAIVAAACILMLPGSPLAALLSTGSTDALLLAELRGQLGIAAAEDKSIVYLRNLGIRYLLQFALIYFSVQYIVFARYKFCYLVLYPAAVFCSAIDVSKAPIVLTLLTPFAVRLFHGRASGRHVVLYAVGSAAMLVALYVVVMGAAGADAISQILHRVTVAQYVGLPVAIEVFPQVESFLGPYSSVGAVAKLAGVEQQFYSRVLMEFVNPAGAEAGVAGFLSTVFFAEGYAMSGWPGAIVSVAVVLVILLSVDSLRLSPSVTVRSVYLLLLIKVPMLVMDSVTSIVWNYGVFVVVAFLGSVALVQYFVLPVSAVGLPANAETGKAPL